MSLDALSETKGTGIFRQTVSESDIDWLFCVELNTQVDFQKWVAARLFPELGEFNHIQAWRSVSNSVGESDILWLVESTTFGRVIGLIENKIDAVAQPEQYLRYVRRGDEYAATGLCQRVSIALLAPEKFRSKDSQAYPIQISYESIAAWHEEKTDKKSIFYASIYHSAINKLGELAPPDCDITCFQERIWQMARAEFPTLNVPDPKSVSASQYWVYMRYSDYTIIYKMYKSKGVFTDCVVDLELAGRGDETDQIRCQYHERITGTGIEVANTGKSSSFRVVVPAIAPPIFDEQKVRSALQAASRLKAWWDSVKE